MSGLHPYVRLALPGRTPLRTAEKRLGLLERSELAFALAHWEIERERIRQRLYWGPVPRRAHRRLRRLNRLIRRGRRRGLFLDRQRRMEQSALAGKVLANPA